MPKPHLKKHSVFAAAKVNLFLHVTKRLSTGYHSLHSLIGFVDVGDQVHIENAETFSFNITGPFARNFSEHEADSFIDGDNLVVRAARTLSQITDLPLNVAITLEKNLPLAAGIGGGSSDAAAVIWGLQEYWSLDRSADYLNHLLIKLGADVPVCYACRPCVISGIGDVIKKAPDMPEVPVVLINPLKPCPTPEIFSRLQGDAFTGEEIDLPKNFATPHDLVDFLTQYTRNDLSTAAEQVVPEISNILAALRAQEHCLLSRMSGSGASCFGLFENDELAQNAAQDIQNDNPDWWVRAGTLNRPERY